MKTKLYLGCLSLYLISTLLLHSTYAQDYKRLNLPNEAKARIGKGIINDIQLSQDATRLAIASSIGVWLHDVNTGIETPLISGHTDSVRLVAFSPNGKILASSAYDKTVRIWDTETGKTIQILTIPKVNLSSLNFLQDDETLVVVNWKGVVSIWNTSTGKQLDTYNPKASDIRIKGVVWKRASAVSIKDTNDVIFAVGNKDGSISIKNGKPSKEIRKLIAQTDANYQFPIQHKQHNYITFTPDRNELPFKWSDTVEFTPDGNTLISVFDYRNANWDGSASFQGGPTEIWDVNTGEQLALISDGKGVEFSGDGKYLAIIGYGKCTIWDIATRREIATFRETDTVKFSGDGKTLVQITRDSYTLWDIATLREINKINPNFDEFKSATERYLLSHDGSVFVSAKVNGIVSVWYTRSKKPLLTLTSGFTKPFTTIGFSPDGKMLAAGDLTGNIRIWNTNTLNKRLSIKTNHNNIRALTFAKDNKTIISESNGDMEVWDIISGVQEKAYYP